VCGERETGWVNGEGIARPVTAAESRGGVDPKTVQSAEGLVNLVFACPSSSCHVNAMAYGVQHF